MKHISQVIAIVVCVILLTISTCAQDNTALPANWTTETPVAWLNAQVTAEAPVIAPDAPADVAPVKEGDAYAIALDALVSVILAIVNTSGGAVVIGLGIWKFAPAVVTVIEALAKLTPRKDDDLAAARLRAELERLGVIPALVTVKPLKEVTVSSTFGRVSDEINNPPYTVTSSAIASDKTYTTILPGSEG